MNQARWRLRRREFLCLGLGAGLAGCQIPGGGEPPQLYTLSPRKIFTARDLPRVDWQLVVEPPLASQGLDSSRIALQRSPLRIDYYARVSWTNPAPLMIQTLLIESLDNTGRIIGVTRESTQLRADYLLQTDLREFQAEYDSPNGPPLVRVRIAAKIVRLSDRTIIGNASFEDAERAQKGEIEPVIAAFDVALGRVLDQTVEWTLRTPQANPRPGAPRAAP